MAKQIELIQMKCPNCGANLDVNKNLDRAGCPYCGAAFVVADNRPEINITNNVTNNHINNIHVKHIKPLTRREVKLEERRLEIEREQKMAQLAEQRRERRRQMTFKEKIFEDLSSAISQNFELVFCVFIMIGIIAFCMFMAGRS